uniref:Methyltransferase n=1 Tax=Steinernema glaseri TaxID=37863 RepID=A0A1I7ZRF4_9BILA
MLTAAAQQACMDPTNLFAALGAQQLHFPADM